MLVSVLLSILILNFHANCETVCDISECECQTGNNLAVVKCVFQQDVPINFTATHNITRLDLSENNLHNIEHINASNLQELFLNKNAIKELKADVFDLPELKTLDLSDNLLEKLQPELFKKLVKLENLYLANNRLSITSQLNFRYLVNLRRINLDNNFVGPDIELRSLFNKTGLGIPLTIQAISINSINLTDVSYNLFDPVKTTLKELSVANNSLSKIFQLPTSLEYLDVSNNPIRQLNITDFPSVDPLIYLRVLKLNSLEIEVVPKDIFSSLNLYELQLSNNKNLRKFSNLTFGRQVLFDSYDFLVKNLTIKGSNLSTIDKSLSVLFKRVERLDLQNNPWNCDCNLAWIQNLSITPDLTENLRCAYPRNLHNVKIFDIAATDFKCSKVQPGLSYHTGVTVGAILYSLLLLFTLLWIYKFLHKPSTSQREYSQLQ